VANFLICLFAAATAAGRQWFLFHPNSKTGAESLGSTQKFPVLYLWVREWVKTMLTFNISCLVRSVQTQTFITPKHMLAVSWIYFCAASEM
jgi:hypothetical protein